VREARPGLPWSLGRARVRAAYQDYMDSPAWRACRSAWQAEWIARYGAEPACLACGQTWTLRHGDLHHASYDRLGTETFTDLLPLCRADHAALHDLWDASPEWRRLGRPAASIGIIAVLRRHRDTQLSRNAS